MTGDEEVLATHVTSYDSLDDAFDAIERARIAADERTTEEQKQLKTGDYFVSDSGYGFPIFGKVLEEYKEKRMSNYRFCECYSVASPYGEKGDVHVSTVGAKIDGNLFRKFKSKGWIME